MRNQSPIFGNSESYLMFSWSFKWLWAQCLFIGMAFFFLGSIALPDARDLTNVEGRITQVGIKYRKGIGSYYTLERDHLKLKRNLH